MRPTKGIHLEDIIEALQEYYPDADTNIILRAYGYASQVHGGQVRASGQAYMSHPMEVALILTQLKVDPATLATALLHDTVEDTVATEREIEDMFGADIARMVEGLTKLAKINFRTREEHQAENMRKMIMALSEDVRIIIIKLADRLHNMRTLEWLNPEKQHNIAQETLDLYAPVANRLGIHWMKAELEDLAFMYAHPNEYTSIKKKMREKREEIDRFIVTICNQTKELLMKEHIAADVAGRVKNLYSIYKKMQEQDLEFDQVFDIIGVRIITTSTMECYHALGAIHTHWKPIPGKFKDYIAVPKENMYQSIHSTVLTPTGRRVEFQFRTQTMHLVSENGIAAHWRYKEGGKGIKPSDEKLIWIRRLVEMGQNLENSEEFMENVKLDLFPDEVYVFSPKQDVYAFPKGATPVDFAYAVHTQVGHHCHRALANGWEVGMDYNLRNGDTLEIITSSDIEPDREWLQYTVTSHARSKILSYIRAREKEDAQRLGRELIEQELRTFKLDPELYMTKAKMKKAAKAFGFKTPEIMLRKIGFSKMPVYGFLQKLLPHAEWQKVENARSSSMRGFVQKLLGRTRMDRMGIKVGNLNNMLIRFARCCNPVPGDRIIGYVTSEQGMVVHQKSCPILKKLEPDPEKFFDAQWDQLDKEKMHPVRIQVYSLNKPGILANVTTAIAACHANITTASVAPTDVRGGELDLTVEITDLHHLQKVLDAVRKVDGVKSVKRIMEGDPARVT